jgi:hypothetical protein
VLHCSTEYQARKVCDALAVRLVRQPPFGF